MDMAHQVVELEPNQDLDAKLNLNLGRFFLQEQDQHRRQLLGL